MSTFAADVLSLIFGIISIVMTIGIEFPQLISIFKTKNTSGTSLATYILFLVASILWVSWASVNYSANIMFIPSDVENIGLHIAALMPAILSNTISLVLVSCILYFKARNMYICKKQNITELQYSQFLFDKQKNYSWIRKYYPLFIMAFATLLVCTTIILILYFIGTPISITQEEYDKYVFIVLALNCVAAIFFESISWPQFIKCMKSKDTSGISLGWAIFLPLSCFICFTYDLFLGFSTGFLNVLASLICSGTVINTLVLILKIKNVLAAKKLGISEWKYTKQYIAKKHLKNKR